MDSLTAVDEDLETLGGGGQESQESGRTGSGARPGPAVSDVLGQPVPAHQPSALRAYAERFTATLRAAVRVVARPHVIGVLVFGLGVLILLLLGYIYLFTPVSAARAQHALLQQITADPQKTFSLAQGGVPAEGSPVAVLEIPAIHLADAVVQGTDAQDLRSGPGHMPTSSMPGQPGNAVIAGRRATFGAPFGAIGSLKRGQVITVVDGLGIYHYKVTRVVYASGGKHDVVTQTASNRLTLVTAASGVFPQGRLAVIATMLGKPLADTTRPRFHPAADELGLAGDPASGLLAVLWTILFFALLSGSAWLLRSWDQPIVVYLLTVPVLLLIALFACESIIGFLPATV